MPEWATDSAVVIPTQATLPLDLVGIGRTSSRSFLDLVRQAAVVDGADLTKNKAGLIGVPFIIVSVTYRDGISKGQQRANYLSIEIVTADVKTWEARVKKGFIPDNCPFGPEESLVFNDGSTGVARQVTAYLHDRGVIDIGMPEDATANLNGPMGESPYDKYRADWATPHVDDVEFRLPTATAPALYCPRGLRESDYLIEGSKEKSYTYYLG